MDRKKNQHGDMVTSGIYQQGMRKYHLVMTNIVNWKSDEINGGLVRWENHLRKGP